uniref:BZIP domain-containing protein n=1 Tax=Kwoniella bestiolae CBS 10118 TaxID=1296100 RepID=A0A1B9FRK1_9TREE|nr:hypothetical protein I302_09068 [Kwoniella bestiolae CBS 10118]OCF21391.1 hypothetical protein I302_09068 [Kwoniella bestiolae CBS 10118]
MGKNTDPTMGGLDALVAAASSVAGQGKKRAGNRGDVPMDMIDPALQDKTSDVADAMSVFLSNPAVVQLIAEYNAKKQHRQVSLYTQLLSGSNIPDTPAQQTRSGRISRPPVHPPPINPFQHLINQNQNQPQPHQQPAVVQNDQQNQLQAIKDALENVSSINDTHTANPGAEAASYDALFQAVSNNNDSSSNASRFWRNDGLLGGLPNWTGLEANTLAQAAAASVTTDPKRSASVLDDNGTNTGDESFESNGHGTSKRYKGDDLSKLGEGEGENGEGLPQWPLPPTGKGGRKNMPREELLARRRARNRVAAQESRKKKKEFFGNIADKLKDRDEAFEQLRAHCKKLEQEVEALRKVVLGAGLELPKDIPTPTPLPTIAGPSSFPIAEDTPMTIDSVSPSDGIDLPFHDLFTIDDNDADDLDFIPPSSPKRDGEDGSDSEGEFSDDDEDINSPFVASTTTKKGNRKGKRKSSKDQTAPDLEGETPISTMAEDVEEDLFLPIEDVPIPPRDEEDQEKVMKQAMTELHVDTPQQLMGVIKKMVETAGYGGVTEEQVAMLSKLLALGQAQGMSIW